MKQKRIGLYQLLALAGLNISVVLYYWFQTSGHLLANGLGQGLVSIGDLCGLLATVLVLGQLVMIGRVRWLETKVGFDTVTRYHRRNGETVFYLILVHPFLISFGYAVLLQTGPVAAFLQQLERPHVALALIGWLIIILLVPLAAVRALRRRLSYEQWYYTHLLMYGAILLVFFHQLDNGPDFGAPLFRLYWYALYAVAFGTILVYRILPVLLKHQKHHLVVKKVEQITPSAVSIIVGGQNIETFKYAPGQFAKWIFLAKGYWWQSHPFTISIEPGHNYIRLSAKGVGSFTKKLGQIPVGTKIILDGPYGVFTPALTNNKKILMIVGGSGITPLRAMVPAMIKEGRNIVLLYGNQTVAETMLANELTALAHTPQFSWHNVLSADPSAPGSHGYITGELVNELIADALDRDVYLCGPPMMVQKLIPQLLAMGMDKDQIHYERFSL